jgi:hypothetical protein
MHATASACLEASGPIARVITALNEVGDTITTFDVQLDVRSRMRTLGNTEMELYHYIGSLNAKELRHAREALNGFVSTYDNLERQLPQSVVEALDYSYEHIRQEMIRAQWDAAFAPTRDHKEVSIFRSQVSGIIALIQSSRSCGILAMLGSIDRNRDCLNRDVLGEKDEGPHDR